MKKITLAGLCMVLSGCTAIGNWADDVGSYMPVLSDQRCEHWQCFTEGGRQQSEMNKQLMQQRWDQEKLEEEQEKQAEQAGQNPAAAQQPATPKYDPPPEMNPYDNYHP